MALLTCCECGQQVSEYAEQCSNCGCPVDIIKENSVKDGETIVKGKKYNVKNLQQFYKQTNENIKAIKILMNITGLNEQEADLYHKVIKKNNRNIPKNLDKAVEEYLEGNRRRTAAIAANSVKCPYCKSANVKKLSFTGKALSVGTLGLFSKKIGKQWHCNKCNSDF